MNNLETLNQGQYSISSSIYPLSNPKELKLHGITYTVLIPTKAWLLMISDRQLVD